jgi:hypothetical protein
MNTRRQKRLLRNHRIVYFRFSTLQQLYLLGPPDTFRQMVMHFDVKTLLRSKSPFMCMFIWSSRSGLYLLTFRHTGSLS